MAVSISNIPRKWDVVSDVIYSHNNTRAQIVFNTGASITVKVANEDENYLPAAQVHTKPKVKITKIPTKPKSTQSPTVQAEAAYRQHAMAALQEMGSNEASLKAAMMTPMVDPAFELAKQRALAESQSRSEKLVSEMTPLTPANIPVNEGVSNSFYFNRQT